MKIKQLCLFLYGMVAGIYLCLAIGTGHYLYLLVTAIWVANGVLMSESMRMQQRREAAKEKEELLQSILDKQRIHFS